MWMILFSSKQNWLGLLVCGFFFFNALNKAAVHLIIGSMVNFADISLYSFRRRGVVEGRWVWDPF